MSLEKLYESVSMDWEDVGKVDLNDSRKGGSEVKSFSKVLGMTLFFILFLSGVGLLFRYHYEAIEDVGLNTTLLNTIILKNQVVRPIRFDRWTGAVEIYLDKGKWIDLADWNRDKIQTIQTSVRELQQTG